MRASSGYVTYYNLTISSFPFGAEGSVDIEFLSEFGPSMIGISTGTLSKALLLFPCTFVVDDDDELEFCPLSEWRGLCME